MICEYVLHAERSRKVISYYFINRTLKNNRIGSASKRSIDLANKKAGEIKGCNTELTDPPPYKPSPSYICSELN